MHERCLPGLTPTQQKALADAVQWHVELTAEANTQKTQKDWHSWLSQQPENHWAWQQLNKLQHQLKQLPGDLAFNSLKLATESYLNQSDVNNAESQV